MFQCQRIQSTPVLAKGSTYGGVQADALAAPAACWDGTRWVMTVSVWNTANAKWYSAFFTSADLAAWSYVSGSLRSPGTGNYILGNSGIAWFGGKYYFAYNEYPSGGPDGNGPLRLQTSTDLLTWTPYTTPLGLGTYYDPALAVHPTTGKLELWYVTADRRIGYADSSDGSTWTDHGVVYNSSSWNVTNFGEPEVAFHAGKRYLTFDAGTESGRRSTGLAVDAAGGTTFTSNGTTLGVNPFNAWESVNVFDTAPVGVVDRGDGRGSKLWVLYAGGDTAAPTDNTNSSIGLAFLDVGAAPAGGLLLKRRRVA